MLLITSDVRVEASTSSKDLTQYHSLCATFALSSNYWPDKLYSDMAVPLFSIYGSLFSVHGDAISVIRRQYSPWLRDVIFCV